MAIGRISGEMLLPDLQRDGVDLAIDGNLIYFNVTDRTVTINDQYSLPNTAPVNKSILYAEGGGSLRTYWAPAPASVELSRKTYTVNIPSLAAYGTATLTLPLGISAMVYNLSVSRPNIKVQVYGTALRNEPNPYTFISTINHLVDDGTVILNDGSSFQSRQYSIFANLEDPPLPQVYATITSLSNISAGFPVILNFYYYATIQS